MPKLRTDWKAEYTDPVSDAEDAEQKKIEDKQNAQIMEDILACDLEIEERKFAARTSEACLISEVTDQQWWDEYEDELYEEEIQYWSRVALP